MNEEVFIPPAQLAGTISLESPLMNAQGPARQFHHFYVPPFSTAHHNGCAQAVMATILTYWNRLAYDANLAETIYKDPACSPNVVWGLFGTNLERFQEAMVKYGLKAKIINEPRNTVFIDVEAKYALLQKWIMQGHPIPVIVGNGELKTGSGFHWAIVVSAGATEVELGNFGHGFLKVKRNDFLRAWSTALLPSIHYGAVLI